MAKLVRDLEAIRDDLVWMRQFPQDHPTIVSSEALLRASLCLLSLSLSLSVCVLVHATILEVSESLYQLSKLNQMSAAFAKAQQQHRSISESHQRIKELYAVSTVQ
jgi:hypothetical protein